MSKVCFPINLYGCQGTLTRSVLLCLSILSSGDSLVLCIRFFCRTSGKLEELKFYGNGEVYKDSRTGMLRISAGISSL